MASVVGGDVLRPVVSRVLCSGEGPDHSMLWCPDVVVLVHMGAEEAQTPVGGILNDVGDRRWRKVACLADCPPEICGEF